MARGGDFQAMPIELPMRPNFNVIREDYPNPLGRIFEGNRAFVAERVGRLAPDGRWTVLTEDREWAGIVESFARERGMTVTTHQIPTFHEATPRSTYIETDPLMPDFAPERFVLTVRAPPGRPAALIGHHRRRGR